MSVQGDRLITDHIRVIAFADRLLAVLLAVDQIILTRDRLAVHGIGIRARYHCSAVRGNAVADHDNLLDHFVLRKPMLSNCIEQLRHLFPSLKSDFPYARRS